MRDITPNELQILSSIKDSQFLNSIESVRLVTESIWASDAPRIIQDYTDHGINHSIRIMGFANKILSANDGEALSSEETYLLILSIYLHDIGMQCDVNKFPNILGNAIKLGAVFDTQFASKSSNGYSIYEQKAIRKNHHYLTAGWIDYAYKTGDTILGSAIKTVPTDLIGDLIDICKHHAKIPIADCSPTFRFDPNGRKQLLYSPT